MLRKFFQSVPKQTKFEAVADKKLSVLAWCVLSLLPLVLLLAVIEVVSQTGVPDKCRGRNAEGQCGVENKPVCVEPVVLHSLESAGVQSVLAGKVHSAAILKTGEVCTWGCGKAGKLGHGSSENYSEPTR